MKSCLISLIRASSCKVVVMFERRDQIHEPLYVITTIFNPIRFRSRWKLYQDFVHMVNQSGAILYICEVAYGERDFVITEPNNPLHLQIRTSADLWFKENALKLLLQRLPLTWKYVAWIDADISFVRSDWANETLHELQRHPIIQMWSKAYDLDSKQEIIQEHHSFVYSWQNNEPKKPDNYYSSKLNKKVFNYHPGFAWAARKDAMDHLGGFIDYAILGAGDNHMAHGLIGNALEGMPVNMDNSYKEKVLQWQQRALRYLKKDIGYMSGTLLHYWHGPKVNRRYWDRWKILTHNKFNPNTDLKQDWQGMYQLDMDDSERMIQLRDQVRMYFKQRNEDQLSE